MGDLFPEDPKLSHFASRYSVPGFDPTVIRPIVSTATQMRTKLVVQSIEQPTSAQNSPRPQYTRETSLRPQVRPESPRPTYLQANNSPKRPFVGEDSDGESNRPRKLVRGESPLKGAAGRRLDQQKRLQQTQGVPSWQSNGPAPFVIPRDITFLLSIIPRAETYTASRFNPEAMARLLSQTQVPDYPSWKAAQNAPPARYDNGMASSHSPYARKTTSSHLLSRA
jgi:cleavage stimulation factor subunit 3